MHPHRDKRSSRRRLMTLLALVPGLAAAQQPAATAAEAEAEKAPRYTVEFILFRYQSGVADGGEVFPPDAPVVDDPLPGQLEALPGDPEPRPGDEPADEAPIPAFGDQVPPREAAEDVELAELVVPADIQLVVLAPGERTLQAAYDKLVELDAYRPVLWTGWTQSTFEENVTPAIRLRRLGRAPLSYDGSFELYLSRFLHLVVDLSLEGPTRSTPTVPQYGDARYDDPRDAGRVHYRIQEDRIVRNGDLRYFDHPKFGLLAKVTRVETDQPDTQDEANAPSTNPGTSR